MTNRSIWIEETRRTAHAAAKACSFNTSGLEVSNRLTKEKASFSSLTSVKFCSTKTVTGQSFPRRDGQDSTCNHEKGGLQKIMNLSINFVVEFYECSYSMMYFNIFLQSFHS